MRCFNAHRREIRSNNKNAFCFVFMCYVLALPPQNAASEREAHETTCRKMINELWAQSIFGQTLMAPEMPVHWFWLLQRESLYVLWLRQSAQLKVRQQKNEQIKQNRHWFNENIRPKIIIIFVCAGTLWFFQSSRYDAFCTENYDIFPCIRPNYM